MECESASVNNLLNSIQSTDIEVGTTVEICTSFFHLGDRFSSFKEIQDAVRNVENKTGTKYWVRDAKKIETQKTKLDNSINQALVYWHLKYTCVQGGRKPSIHVSRGNRVRVRFNTSTLRNGCQAHIKFGVSLDKQYLEVKSCSDVHNHEISKIRARTKVRQLLASEGVDVSPWQSANQNCTLSPGQTQGTKCLVVFPEQTVDGQTPGGIVILPGRPTKEEISSPERFLNEDLFSGPDDIPEINAEEPVTEITETEDKMILIKSRADKAVEDLVREKKRSNDLKEKLLEESRKRNQYLEALLRIKCLKYNQTLEELMHE